jgi:hypothetical protein
MTVLGTANRLRSSRSLRVGLAIGLGIAARTVVGRKAARTSGGLVDWERAQRIAHRRLVRAPGRLTAEQLRLAAPAYARHMSPSCPR